ncbi:MAG: MBL fold metallo-hydrolase [Clostridiales bacterium]|nr:MBL fold metallo-hydrolase [Clostridiales bacterium]
MKITVLIENKHNCEKALPGEHGLSIYIEYKGKKILLDAGATDLFSQNADLLGVPLEMTDFSVLSHAHYDHSGGFEKFFEKNLKAVLYMQSSCRENCWRLLDRLHAKKTAADDNVRYSKGKTEEISQEHLKYIGIPSGMLKRCKDRIRFVSGDCLLFPGAWLIAHHSSRLWEKGREAGMLRLENGRYCYDDFSHEQSLVFETKQGLVIFNSCCHAGPDMIVNEVQARPCFNGQKVDALIGGFHLKDMPQNEQGSAFVKALGKRLAATGIARFFTGHCTGDWAFEILAGILNERLCYLKTGDEYEWA